VFALAALSKLADRATTARGFRALGVPGRLATLVPVVELAVAATLVVLPGWGAALALALLVAFTTLLALAVRRGVTAPCNCFGRARSAPVSHVELARNGTLLVGALVALTASRPTIPDPGAGLVVALAAVAVGLGVRTATHEGPRRNRPAPPLANATWPALVAFHSPGCPRCELDLPAVEARTAQVVTLSPSTAATFRAWRVRATPYYVVVDGTGIVRQRTPDLAEVGTFQT
jgi:hypothetical protein